MIVLLYNFQAMVFSENPLPKEAISSPETQPSPLMHHLVLIPQAHEPWVREDQQHILQTITTFADTNNIAHVTLCLTNRTEAESFAETLEGITTGIGYDTQKTKIHFKTERGRDEILEAVKTILDAKPHPDTVSEAMFNDLIDFSIPDPDFVLQLGDNESRADDILLANFMLWQTAYSEYGKTNLALPDISVDYLDELVKRQYKPNNRRFGGLPRD